MLQKLIETFSRLAPERKRSATGPLVALHQTGRAQWTPRNYAAMAREGFQGNAIGYRCVRMVAEAAASVPFLLFDGERERDEHPMMTLLKRPNPAMAGRELLESVYGFLQLSGNAYVEAVSLDGAVRELHALRPDRMRAVAGANGWAEAYEYSVNGQSVRLPREAVLHARLFHPLDDYYGLSPLEAAARAIDTHNAASTWNKAMLDNAARPSGALVFKADSDLTDDQFARFKHELQINYQGAGNAGRPLVLQGGFDWKQMSYAPKDMEFNEAKNMAAREIALAFGVPPMLLGIPGDNTYSNYAEANRAFWRQTALPLAGRLAEALTGWLAPQFGEGLKLEPDADQVEALSSEREALWARIGAAAFLTDDEKRAAVGYGVLAGSR
jgi:HK97 family phage portal protein